MAWHDATSAAQTRRTRSVYLGFTRHYPPTSAVASGSAPTTSETLTTDDSGLSTLSPHDLLSLKQAMIRDRQKALSRMDCAQVRLIESDLAEVTREILAKGVCSR